MEYKENQTLGQSQLKWLVIVSMIFPIITNISFLSKGKMDFWPDFVLTTLLLLITFALIFFIKLKTRINQNGIYYQFKPFQWKERFINWSEIDKAYLRKYDPLTEYGGWGLKGWKLSNRAVNISGDEGFQLVLKNGKKLLIGTNSPTQMQQYLEQFAKLGIEAVQKTRNE